MLKVLGADVLLDVVFSKVVFVIVNILKCQLLMLLLRLRRGDIADLATMTLERGLNLTVLNYPVVLEITIFVYGHRR